MESEGKGVGTDTGKEIISGVTDGGGGVLKERSLGRGCGVEGVEGEGLGWRERI